MSILDLGPSVIAGHPVGQCVRVSRTLKARPDVVFDAWVNPDKLQRWWAGENRLVEIHALDVRIGGEWRIAFATPDANHYEMGGVYQEVSRPEKLSFSWTVTANGRRSETSLVVIDFAAEGEGTMLTVAHHLHDGSKAIDSVGAGWKRSLGTLVRVVDGSGSLWKCEVRS
ncbi:MAG: SRPBCC domain-containing protein [Pseudomonadota bacterium]